MKYKFYNTIFIIIISVLFVKCKQVENPVDRVYFQFEHSLRIPYHKVDIEIIVENDIPKIKVTSIPMFDNEEWIYSKIDTIFEISNYQFQEIIKSIDNISDKDNEINKDTLGIDGSIWKIEYCTSDTLKKYKIWSPDYDTEERKLTEFVEASNLIVEIAGLTVEEVLFE